jgi:hypothetical protein
VQLIRGRLEAFAAQLHGGLEAADWASKRDLIRALVKRVEVAQNDVNIVFRIDPYPGDNDPEKKVGNFVGGEATPPCGTPVSVGCQLSPSHTPARKISRINCSTRPSLISSAIKSMSLS